MRCGLHYVRFCDLRTKRCTGVPACQAVTKAIADALAGGPSREGRSTPLRSTRLALARGPRGPDSLVTASSWITVCRGRQVRPPPRSRPKPHRGRI